MGRTSPLTSKRFILYIYSTNIGTEYFKHALYSPFFSLKIAVCFIMLICLVPVLFTFYIQSVLELKKKFRSQRVTKPYSHKIALQCSRISDVQFIACVRLTQRYVIVNPYPANVENRVSS